MITLFPVKAESSEPISGIAILDIDFFKKYNDAYGHLAGDKCPRQIGKCLIEYGKEHEMVFYRYGGEEFVAISHNNDITKIKSDFNDICSTVCGLHIKHDSSYNGFVTISGGFVELDLIQQETVNITEKNNDESDKAKLKFQQILAKADNALYNAKQLGRNQMVVYTSES